MAAGIQGFQLDRANIVAQQAARFGTHRSALHWRPDILARLQVKKLIALLVVVLLLAGLGWFAFVADYSDGYRVGQVIKLSRSGYVFKTWEGTLDFGFLQQDPAAGVATRLWDFSVRDDDEQVRKDIDTAIAGNRKVKLHYREKYFRWSWMGDTKHFVDKVELAG
jgi:hypothetical protein